jgi:modification methylase
MRHDPIADSSRPTLYDPIRFKPRIKVSTRLQTFSFRLICRHSGDSLILEPIDNRCSTCHKKLMTDSITTSHVIRIDDAGSMSEIEDQSIDLVITSPPYPMIKMWDEQFGLAAPRISEALAELNGGLAFELMHQRLDLVWEETLRILKPGGIACINIGDATRTLNGHFQLFPNHARVITKLMSLGFSQLPTILWRKPTNAPNKYMGSGMLPPGAYVTLEHEYIIIARKGSKREFDNFEKINRRQSAYFWEERNAWFSDVWFDLLGTAQKLNGRNKRSGAFPLELPLRLINMFSTYGDTVVDPFLGSGTTMIAAMCSARNSIGYEIDKGLQPAILEKIANIPAMANKIIRKRVEAHNDFVHERQKTRGNLKYTSRRYGFPVVTRQEEDLRFYQVQNIQYQSGLKYLIGYTDIMSPFNADESLASNATQLPGASTQLKGRQLKMF